MDVDPERMESKDESSTSNSDEEVDEVYNTFEAIKKEINEDPVYLDDPQKIKRFKDTYKDSLRRRTSRMNYKKTLLHVLVEGAKDKDFDRYRPLVKIIIEEHPNILTKTDKSGETSLYTAITKKRNELVRFICEQHPDINSVLEQRCAHAREETCIHAAIRNGVSTNLAYDLIKKASQKVLCIQDFQGNTPLHLAVEYSRCTEEQLQTVEILAERGGSEAMNKLTKDTCRSPYLHHIHTRPKANNGANDANNVAYKQVKELTQKKSSKSNSASLDGAMRKDGEGIINKTHSMADSKAPVNHGEPSLSYSKSENTDSAVRSPLRPNESIDKDPTIPNGQVTGMKRTTELEKRKKKPKGKVTEGSANAVKEFLMLHCMRTLNTKDAEDFLYGKTQGKEICFDLCNQSSLNITEDQIEQGFGPLEFERFLKYVAFPKLQIDKRPVRQRGKSVKTDSKGRDDMTVIFNFLREDKKVDRIIHVIVADQDGIAHSDAAIEKALGGFKVEIWEWQKFDICTETIARAAPDVEQVHLYWSGNNAVLRGWSDAEVLKRMGKLKKVYLHTTQGLEAAQRTNENVTMFTRRMKKCGIEVESTDEEQPIKHEVSKAHTEAELERRHQWLICMDGFADFIQGLRPTSPSYKPITIALIDDGFDVKEKSLYNRYLRGKSFSLSDDINRRERPWYDSGGHGTAMASLICRICPNAKIIPLRLEEYPGNENSKRQITAKSAAEALSFAVERKADIISMSWTIKKTEENTSYTKQIDKAIKMAAANGILMFCAASDGGAVTDQTFPAESQRESVFKIGAATEEGKAWKWVGEEKNIDFIFPGHEVVQERYKETLLQHCNLLTGSSVATAIAAGLAALVLDCVQLAALHYGDLVEKQKELSESSMQQQKLDVDQRIQRAEKVLHDDYVNLKSTKEMKAAFNRIGLTSERYVKVWELFEDGPKKAVGKTSEEKTETIVGKIVKKLKG